MAIRYSGQVRISVTYRDQGDYKCSVSGPDGRWSGIINPAPAGFGRGVAYDSPEAYDEIARSAVSFAAHDKRGIDERAAFGESDVHVGRTKATAWGNGRSRSATRPRKKASSKRRSRSATRPRKRNAKKSANRARKAYRVSGRRRLAKEERHIVKRASRRGTRPSSFPAYTAAARKRGYGRDRKRPAKRARKPSRRR